MVRHKICFNGEMWLIIPELSLLLLLIWSSGEEGEAGHILVWFGSHWCWYCCQLWHDISTTIFLGLQSTVELQWLEH